MQCNSPQVTDGYRSFEALSIGAAAIQVVERLIDQQDESGRWFCSYELVMAGLCQVKQRFTHRAAEQLSRELHLHFVFLVLDVKARQLVGRPDSFPLLQIVQRL